MQGLRAASYSRVSTTQQEFEGSSLTTQAKAIADYLAKQGYELAQEHVYQDVHSGFDLRERPGITRAREALRAGEFDVLVFFAVDRLTRNQSHLGILVDEADRYHVRLECVTEQWEDSSIGKFIANARAFAAELEREKIKERTTRGRDARLEMGRMLPGPRAPYGYQWKDAGRDTLITHPDTAPVVERIFDLVASGTPARSVAKLLTEEGIFTPTGKEQWAVCTITEMLRNETYTGTFVSRREKWERVSVLDANGTPRKKKVKTNRPESEHVLFQVPALVSLQVAEAAQSRLSLNRSMAVRNNRDPERALLRGGFAVCGYCGCVLNANNHGRGRVTYTCNQSNRDRYGCPNFGVETHLLDGFVWSEIAKRLKNPELIAKQLMAERSENPVRADLASVEKRLATVARKQANLVKRLADIEDDDLATLVSTELTSLTKQATALKQERDTLQVQQADWDALRTGLADLAQWCEQVSQNLDSLGYDDKRQALIAMGVRVQVWEKAHDPRWELQASVPIVSATSRRTCTPRSTSRRPGTRS